MSKYKNRKNIPSGYTRHHRKPKSLGGDFSDRNISVVPKRDHDAWTTLFDNLPAPLISVLFLFYLEKFEGENVNLACCLAEINASILKEIEAINEHIRMFDREELEKRRRIRQDQETQVRGIKAWLRLYGAKSLEEKVEITNKVWLDPDYKFQIIESDGKKTVVLRLSSC